MGVNILLQDNLMLVQGSKSIKGTNVHSRHDHRIAMACAVTALVAEGDTIIEEADAINKSYPNFYQHLEQLGALIS
jgi:3-phosphoshikimate 1-carboxyvinyltransferase